MAVLAHSQDEAAVVAQSSSYQAAARISQSICSREKIQGTTINPGLATQQHFAEPVGHQHPRSWAGGKKEQDQAYHQGVFPVEPGFPFGAFRCGLRRAKRFYSGEPRRGEAAG